MLRCLEQLRAFFRPAGFVSRSREEMGDAAGIIGMTGGELIDLVTHGREQPEELLALTFRQVPRLPNSRFDFPHPLFHHAVTSNGGPMASMRESERRSVSAG